MTCYRQYSGVLKIDTEMKCFKHYRVVLKFDTEIASVLYIQVHSSRDRHCGYVDISISPDEIKSRYQRRDQNRQLRITFVFGIAEGDRVATLRQRNSIKPQWASRKLSDLPTWRWLEQPAHLLMF
jgi:hypothetical protein